MIQSEHVGCRESAFEINGFLKSAYP